MTTSHDLIAASADADLKARIVAILAAEGHDTPAATVETRIGRIVAQQVGDQGQTVADVHAYATSTREQAIAALPPRPGADPSSVTDDHLRAALTALGLLPTPNA